MQDAVAWLSIENKSKAPVFYEDTRMIYYAKTTYKGNWDDNWSVTLNAIKNDSIRNHQYLAITHSKKNPERLEYINRHLPEYTEIKRFNNYRAKKFIVIYKKLDHS